MASRPNQQGKDEKEQKEQKDQKVELAPDTEPHVQWAIGNGVPKEWVNCFKSFKLVAKAYPDTEGGHNLFYVHNDITTRQQTATAMQLFEKLEEFRDSSNANDIPQEDLDYLRFMRVTEPFRGSLFQSHASESSKSYSPDSKEEPQSREEKQATTKKNRDNRADIRDYRFGLAPKSLFCSVSGAEVKRNANGAQNVADAEQISCHHIIATGMGKISKVHNCLTDNNSITFDYQSRRNMIFMKNKYDTAFTSHKWGVEWTQKDGYKIFVQERFRPELPNIHGRQFVVYVNGEVSNDVNEYPSRRALAWQLCFVQETVSDAYEKMERASFVAPIKEKKINK